MGIERDIFEERYGTIIDATDKYCQEKVDEVTKSKNLEIDWLNFKIDNLQKMLLNVCENVYKLKADLINLNQLVSIVNGCLDGKVIDNFVWKYLTPESMKEAQIRLNEQEIETKKQIFATKFIQDNLEDDVQPDDTGDITFDLNKKQFKNVEYDFKALADLFKDIDINVRNQEVITKNSEFMATLNKLLDLVNKMNIVD